MKWILIENIMGHKYTRWKQKKRKYPNEKKLKSPNNYNILKWELKIFDTCIHGNYMYIWLWGHQR